MKHMISKLMNFFKECKISFSCLVDSIRLMILSFPSSYFTKDQMEQLNDSIATALKREKAIMNSIDYLLIEAASSGYYSEAEIGEISTLANKQALKSLFKSLRLYKTLVEDSYYSMEIGDVTRIPFNLLVVLKDLQKRLNRFMEFFAIVREEAHVPVEKLHFDDYLYQSISA